MAPLNFAMSSGEKIWIQTGDPSNPPLTDSDVIPAYLTADAAQGATMLSIDDGSGNPVTITASQGDRVLSNTQSPWIIHAKEEVANKFDNYMQGFVDAGGQADVIFIDMETSISETIRMSQDPRWDDASMGLDGKSLKKFVQDSPYTLQEIIDAGPGDPASNWSKAEFTGKLLSDAVEEALFDVAQSHFPDIQGSDYSQTGVTEANSVWDTDGNERWNPHVFGTHGSHPLYASIRQFSNTTPDGSGKVNDVGTHPYAVTHWQVRYVRGMHQSTGGKVMPWLTYENLIDSFFNLEVRDTPYYEEHVRHMALHTDSDVPVLYFNARGDGGPDKGDDQQDLNFNSVLAGLNSQISADSYQTVTTQKPAWDTDVFATAIETPNKRLWRVTAMRVDPKDDRDIVVDVSNGDTVTIPGGSVGAWYETAKGVDVTFSYQHPPVDNLLASNSWLDFQSSVWNVPGGATKVSDPDGGMDAYDVDTDPTATSNDITLDPGAYTFSVWVKRGSNNANMRVMSVGGDRLAGTSIKKDDPRYADWVRKRLTFEIGSSQSGMFVELAGNRSNLFLYKPMINEGKRAGPYAPPEAPSPGSQEISLQKGGNLVSTAVDPTYPDLEAVLGGATSSIARIVTQDDQVFDPSEGTDEIGTWDPTEAYTIYAESPASFDVEGTVVGAEEVSLDAGWNWLPHLGSTSVPVDQAFDTIQNDLVMVKDEAGRVYRPAQGTDQIGSLEPGTAYKILLETPVTLSYPLE
ncbi:hypothetical protein [Salinibacter ruber]|uniref:hypothetical protein n=1 Tax=Salinibacter ruber TaxID=146919 RepID=UPI002072EECB|nr:hypothetical protein [Salinibacter ruber]